MFTLAKSKPIISSTKDLKNQYFEFTICSQLGLGKDRSLTGTERNGMKQLKKSMNDAQLKGAVPGE